MEAFSTAKSLMLCLGVGAGCESPEAWLRHAWRPAHQNSLRAYAWSG